EKSGKSKKEIEMLLPFKVFEGDQPTTTILIDELTPQSIGKLVAMYEHKIFTEGVIWNIYSYDQWGVELGKVLADKVLDNIENKEYAAHDSSTTGILKRFGNLNN
ncbi:MAG: glucose-6-phosphate isomerase, partial [Nonlabens ulvanivorans]